MLTAREHYIAHLLLFRKSETANERIKMGYALNAMKRNCIEQRALTARQYDVIRKIYSQTMSEKMTGVGNSFYGKTHREKTLRHLKEINSFTFEERWGADKSKKAKEKMSLAFKGKIPWNLGMSCPPSEIAKKSRSSKAKKRLCKYYLISRPDGIDIIVKGLLEFCKLETERTGIRLNRSGFKNILNPPRPRIGQTYFGYNIKILSPEMLEICQATCLIHETCSPNFF